MHEPTLVVDFRVDPPSLGTLYLRGELDLAGAQLTIDSFDAMLSRLVVGAVCEVDLSELTFCDSSGLHALLVCASLARRQGARMVTVGAQPHFLRLVAITGTAREFGLDQSNERTLN